MRKAAHRVSLEAGDALRQGGALGDGEVVNLLVAAHNTHLVANIVMIREVCVSVHVCFPSGVCSCAYACPCSCAYAHLHVHVVPCRAQVTHMCMCMFGSRVQGSGGHNYTRDLYAIRLAAQVKLIGAREVGLALQDNIK